VENRFTGVVGELHPDDYLSPGGDVGDVLQVVGVMRLVVGVYQLEWFVWT
jgi:hypothetical protein